MKLVPEFVARQFRRVSSKSLCITFSTLLLAATGLAMIFSFISSNQEGGHHQDFKDDGPIDVGKLEPVKLVRSDKKKTCLYYANWTIYSRKHSFLSIPAKEVTNLFYCFFDIDKNTGDVKVGDSWADIEQPYQGVQKEKVEGLFAGFYELKKLNRHLKLSMSIGGWSNRDNFKQGVNTVEKLDNFVRSAIGHLVKFGFDGIDLDWEYPSTTKEAAEYLSIIKKLRSELRKLEKNKGLPRDSFLITMAAPAFDEKLDLLNITEIDKYLSFWNLMTYDFAGSWSEKTGYHSNLFKANEDDLCGDDAVQYFLDKGVDRQKLILGMANYGRSFGHTTGFGKPFKGVGSHSKGESDGIVSYFELPPEGFKESYDSKSVSAFAYNAKDHSFVSYDNIDSIKAKAKYVVSKDLGGGMWWESSGDNYEDRSKSLLHTFVTGIGGEAQLDRTPNVITAYDDSHYLGENLLL